MSIHVTTDIFCDLCSQWTYGVTKKEEDISKAREEAKKKGWWIGVSTINGETVNELCPDCAEKFLNIKKSI